MTKERLDILVQRLAGVTRSQAQGLIHTGKVFDAEGNRLDKPGMRLPPEVSLDIKEGPRFVSRGGEKLAAAFDAFPIDVTGVTAIDVGASTGGFTQCLLEHGAAKVFAVDVGYGQLAWELRQDPRVVVMERTNIRHLTAADLPERPAFFTADCSFISLRLVLSPLRDLIDTKAEGVVLIKPQFEAGPEDVGRGGVVHDESVRQRVIEEVLTDAASLGFARKGVIPSPLKGPAGNVEFLAHLQLRHA
jgi:23S rRNA (cytidine1920-2'-O)/16S rRNA (cytidine1409-2'-O)-methyltransferase